MLKPFGELHPRQKAALTGGALGLTILLIQPHVLQASRYTHFRRTFRDGVYSGVGVGTGMIFTISVLRWLGDLTSGHGSGLATQPQHGGRPDTGSVEEKRRAAAAGALIALLVGVATQTLYTFFSWTRVVAPRGSVFSRSTPGRSDLIHLQHRAARGASLGTGLLLAAAALNWMLEEVDSIAGERGSQGPGSGT